MEHNTTFIGIPHSAKSGYLRFMIQEQNLLSEIVGDTKVIFIDPAVGKSPIQVFADELMVEKKVNSILQTLEIHSKVIVVLYRDSYWVNLDEQNCEEFRVLYEKIRQKNANVTYLFLASETNPFQRYNTFFTQYFRDQFQGYVDYFHVLDRVEFDYTVKRLAIMNGKSMPSDYEKLYELTGGIYYILRSAVLEFSDKNLEVEKLYTKSLVQSAIEYIVNIVSNDTTNMTYDDMFKLGLVDGQGRFKSEWLVRALKEQIPSELTQNEERILTILKDNRGSIVSRDIIAKTMWGSNYLERYSEWAIEKVISRIRKKLNAQRSELKLIIYKSDGYGIE
ncbi:MAG TPA: helix-turn-helix domain-containing protein [Candidatus Dojkabacteria bacterium]|nr:helix-turn-helix domain-containing protein [Candidatus Dojkabacteria bacterium]HQF36658.1 helix-turn-helix domain-containing protein [Candidatus Dojkabacteria bacterium]